jgi:hypothetical protein
VPTAHDEATKTLGKEHTVKNLTAKVSLPALGKDFAEG